MADVRDIPLTDGRTVRAHDGGPPDAPLTLLWHHGSPQTGALLDPLVAATAQRDVRLVSYARPSYGGSSPNPGRDVASAARDVEQIAEALGIDRFAVMGASGGGPHALACAGLLGERVWGAVCLASPAPLTDDFDWFAGMISPGGLRSALRGREARAHHAQTAAFDTDSFTAADWAALRGDWTSLAADAGRAGAEGPAGLVDDDLAFISPWGFVVDEIGVPVLLVHGGEDRVVPATHSDWLAAHCPRSELWSRPADGHVSVLDACPAAIDWLIARADPG